jgi:hypothetical protein
MASFAYREGERRPVWMKLDKDSADTVVGMAMTESGATSGYIKEVDASGEAVIGFAMQIVEVTGASDGLCSVLVDVSEESVYEVGPDAGTVTQALVNKTMDVGANGLSVNIDASSTDDIEVIGVDTVANTLSIRLRRVLAGVV